VGTSAEDAAENKLPIQCADFELVELKKAHAVALWIFAPKWNDRSREVALA
jgi:hypothetical protein